MASIFLRGDTWYLKYTAGGEEFRKSLKTTSKRAAEQKKQAFEMARLTGSTGPLRQTDLTIGQLVEKYLDYGRGYFKKPDGTLSSEIRCIEQATNVLVKHFGNMYAKDFGPVTFEELRDHMIAKDWARTNVNAQAKRVRRMFKWGVSKELVPADIYIALTTVIALKAGRTTARESEPIKPVEIADVEKIRPLVSRQVRALIDLQLTTGCRPSELLMLTPQDVDTTNPNVWRVVLAEHKTAHKGKTRTIYLGPKSQAILKPFLDRPCDDDFCFSPREAEKERHAKAEKHRRKNQKPNEKKTERVIRDFYDVDSYRRAIKRACDVAQVTPFHPHRLRHTFATYVRKNRGVEAAQVLLGHARADVTQVYAERDEELAIETALALG